MTEVQEPAKISHQQWVKSRKWPRKWFSGSLQFEKWTSPPLSPCILGESKSVLAEGCRELSTFESSLGCTQHSAETSQNKSFETNKNCSRLAVIVFSSPGRRCVFCFISKYYDCIQEFLLLYTYTDSPPTPLKLFQNTSYLWSTINIPKCLKCTTEAVFRQLRSDSLIFFLPGRTKSVAVNHLLHMNNLWSGDLRDVWTSESCWTHEWFNQEPWWTEEAGPLCDSLIKHFKLRHD